MANTNPFSEDEDLSTQEDEVQEHSSHESSPTNERISWDHVARKLLEEQYLLTALELHTELIEAGRENPKLRDFFSNPANFERTRQADVPNTTLRELDLNLVSFTNVFLQRELQVVRHLILWISLDIPMMENVKKVIEWQF